MGHTVSCEKAASNSCRCPCGGARHGGVLIAGLRTSSDDARERAKQWTEPRRWRKDSSGVNRSKTTSVAAQRQSTLNSVVAELVSTLIDHTTDAAEIDAVNVLAKEISDDIADEFEKHLSGGGPSSKRSRHLWCVVIAAICRAYDQAGDTAKESVDALTDLTIALLRRETSESRSVGAEVTDIYWQRKSVARAFEIDAYTWIGVLIKKALSAIVAAIKAIGEETAMKHVRLIGAIICPDPDRHPAVVKHCMWPLLSGPFRGILEDSIAAEMRMWVRNAYVVIPSSPKRVILDGGA